MKYNGEKGDSMRIFASDSTLEFFNQEGSPQKADKSFNQWAMMVKRFKRRNLLLLMHVPSSYLVIFYGIKKPAKNKSKDLITQLMREFYRSKMINETVINQLVSDDELSFHSIPTKKITRYLETRYEDLVSSFNDFISDFDRFDQDTYLQSDLIDEMNWFEGIHYQRKQADSFFMMLEENYPDVYANTDAIEIKTKLLLDNYNVERHFIVDPDMSLHDLHRLLQIGYQYTDSYVHSFYTLDDTGEVLDEISNLFEWEDYVYSTPRGIENETTIGEVFEEVSQFMYVYNFDADWRILITPIKKHTNINMRLPHCSHSFSEAPHETLESEEDYDFYLEFIEHMVHPLLRHYFEMNLSFDLSAINNLIEKEMYR